MSKSNLRFSCLMPFSFNIKNREFSGVVVRSCSEGHNIFQRAGNK